MLINPDSAPSNSSTIMPVATVCSHCRLEERRLMHQVRHRGVFKRLCTSCVLRLHPQSFCPTCFHLYPSEPAPPSNDTAVSCSKCFSSSHSRCVEASSSISYVCPLCLHPDTPLFKLRSPKMENFSAMDRDAAKKLVAAAKIASVSMNKAAVAAKAEAERRAREAAYARKRAKDALDHVALLVAKEKYDKREAAALARPAIGTNGGYKIDRETNANASASASSNMRNGNANGNVGVPKIEGNVDRDNSSQVLAALNAVELKENEKLGGKNTAPMDVEDEKGENAGGLVGDVDEKGENAGGLVGEKKNDTSSDGPSNHGSL